MIWTLESWFDEGHGCARSPPGCPNNGPINHRLDSERIYKARPKSDQS